MKDTPDNTDAAALKPSGQSPAERYNGFWRSCGIQVVTPGQPYESATVNKLFLLTETNTLVLFNPRQAIDEFSWIRPRLLCIRLHAKGQPAAAGLARLGLTGEPQLAEAWCRCGDTAALWHNWRREIPQIHRAVLSIPGRICRTQSRPELETFMQRLATVDRRPEPRQPGGSPE